MENQFSFKKSLNSEEETVLECKVTSEKFMAVKEKTYKRLSQDVKMPGFRPGKAPRALIEAQISSKVFDETLNELIPEITSGIMEKEDITPLNQVRYELIKVSDAEGVEFKAIFVALPKITLADFSKIKIKKEVKEIKDEEVVNETVRIVDYYSKAQKKDNAKEEEKTAEKPAAKDITDETVKALGIGFSDLKSLQDQVRKELEVNNTRNSEVKWLNDLVKEAVSKSKIKVPKILVDQSVTAKEKDYTKKLEDLNLKMEEFLKVQKTSIEKLREDWRKEAESRLAEELLLLLIIRQEKIQVAESEVNNELARITEAKTKEDLSTPDGRRYLITVLLQQKAMTWLKQQAEK